MVNICMAIVGVKKKSAVYRKGGTESVVVVYDYNNHECSHFALSGQYPYNNEFMKIENFENIHKIKEKVDMRKTGYKGRIFYDKDSKVILKFETNEEINNKYRDPNLLYYLANMEKENIILPDINWKYEESDKYEFQLPKRIIRDILKENYDINILKDCIKKYIVNKTSENDILSNLKTYNRVYDEIEVNPDNRPNNILKDKWIFELNDLTITSKWIEFDIPSKKIKGIINESLRKNGIIDKNNNISQNIKDEIKQSSKLEDSSFTYKDTIEELEESIGFGVLDYLNIKGTTRNKPFVFKLDCFDPEDIKVDLGKEKGALTIRKI